MNVLLYVYFGGVRDPGYYQGYTEPFNPENYPHGTLVGSPYWEPSAKAK
jgi:hypothetical protein